MRTDTGKYRIAVVSPFVDKRHGTERCLAEQLEHLARDYDVHLFSSRVEDLDLSRITWHHVPQFPGPQIARYAWWFAINHIWRWSESTRSGGKFALVYSPGVNCLDANVILVHHVFADHRDRLRDQLRLRSRRLREWPRLIHRRLFYGLIGWLESRVYRRRGVVLAAVSQTAATDLERRFRPGGSVATIYHGVNPAEFNPDARLSERERARQRFGFHGEDFVVLMIGNDWEKKGLPCLLKALKETGDLPVSALIVGNDQPAPYRAQARRLGVDRRLQFASVNSDVLQFYATADAYVAPSLYDPFGLPVLEAMACGLPVIASRAMGVSELINNGENGLILEDPQSAIALAATIRRLLTEDDFRCRLASAASATALKFTWEANTSAVVQQFEHALRRSRSSGAVAPGKA